MKYCKLKQQNYTIMSSRGFKSHPVRSLNINDLSGECSKSVTRELNDKGVRRLVAALCLRGFIDRLTYGRNARIQCETTQHESLEELETFIRCDAPRLWEAIGLNFLSGDWLLRRCRQRENSISMRWYQTEGGAG